MMNHTVFGINGKNIQVGGEAGPEAILPLSSKVLGEIGAGIVKATNVTNSESGDTYITVNDEVANDYDVDRMIDIIEERLGEKETRTNGDLGFT
ncbi:hypothetical protein ACQV2X_07980 [Facklamia sp. P12945]|uniref:hypothetical protein n=1 Tax=Facklamia sp. P12945 TaxID=3421950 RepID=UPI003D17E15B